MQAIVAHVAHGRAAIARGDFRAAVAAFGRALALANRDAWAARGRILAALSFARRQLATRADAAARDVSARLPSPAPATLASDARPAAPALPAPAAPVSRAPAGIGRAAAFILATCCAMAARLIRAAFGPHGAAATSGTIRAQFEGVEHDHDQIGRSPKDPSRHARGSPPDHAGGPPGAHRRKVVIPGSLTESGQ